MSGPRYEGGHIPLWILGPGGGLLDSPLGPYSHHFAAALKSAAMMPGMK